MTTTALQTKYLEATKLLAARLKDLEQFTNPDKTDLEFVGWGEVGDLKHVVELLTQATDFLNVTGTIGKGHSSSINDALPTMTLTLLSVPITTLAQGKAFIEELHAQEALFHFEDSPYEVGKGSASEWEHLFTHDEAEEISRRVDELYALDWSEAGHECPIGYALEVMKRAETES